MRARMRIRNANYIAKIPLRAQCHASNCAICHQSVHKTAAHGDAPFLSGPSQFLVYVLDLVIICMFIRTGTLILG